MTDKLKLPIELGKTYRRRDGKVVEAGSPLPGILTPPFDHAKVVWTAGGELTGEVVTNPGLGHVWVGTGLVSTPYVEYMETAEHSPYDLVEGPLDETPSPKPAPQGHPHAELMAQYAEDARTHAEPWRLWEWDLGGGWEVPTGPIGFFSNNSYRRRPEPARTININGHEVPEPLREAPKKGAEVWSVDLHDLHWDRAQSGVVWEGDSVDLAWLQRGLFFATQEGAEACAKALLSFTAREAS